MKKQIILQNKKVAYTLRKSKRARRMRLVVYCNGSIVVTMPHDLEETIVEKFIREKAQWLFSKISYFKQFKGRQIIRYSHKDYLNYRYKAQILVEERIKYFNKKYGFHYNKINVKNQKTRWGSCSKKRNLNFNFKILFLEEKARDYIIVHEICHLRELNHSKNFWELVAKIFPEWRAKKVKFLLPPSLSLGREIKKELKNKII